MACGRHGCDYLVEWLRSVTSCLALRNDELCLDSKT